MNTQMGYSAFKILYNEVVYMEIEAEWREETKIMITKEENYAEREYEEIGKTDWLVEKLYLTGRREKKPT